MVCFGCASHNADNSLRRRTTSKQELEQHKARIAHSLARTLETLAPTRSHSQRTLATGRLQRVARPHAFSEQQPHAQNADTLQTQIEPAGNTAFHAVSSFSADGFVIACARENATIALGRNIIIIIHTRGPQTQHATLRMCSSQPL